MSFETEDESGTIEIDFNDGSIKGKTTAGDWKKHFDKVREAFE